VLPVWRTKNNGQFYRCNVLNDDDNDDDDDDDWYFTGHDADREALQILPQRRFDISSPSAVVGTFGVTSNSLSGTTSSSSWACCCSAASTLACKLLVLTTLWLVSVYTLCRGAANISSVVDVPAVFTTNVNLVYIMSWVFLQRQFISVRVCSLFSVGLYTLCWWWKLYRLENHLVRRLLGSKTGTSSQRRGKCYKVGGDNLVLRCYLWFPQRGTGAPPRTGMGTKSPRSWSFNKFAFLCRDA